MPLLASKNQQNPLPKPLVDYGRSVKGNLWNLTFDSAATLHLDRQPNFSHYTPNQPDHVIEN